MLHFATESNHVHRRPNLHRSSPGSRPSSLRCGRTTLTPAPVRRSHAAPANAEEPGSGQRQDHSRISGLTISFVEQVPVAAQPGPLSGVLAAPRGHVAREDLTALVEAVTAVEAVGCQNPVTAAPR